MKCLIFVFIVLICVESLSAEQNISKLGGFNGEPSIAVNPSNPSNIISGWMRLRADGKIWIAVRSSLDGGTTWGNITYMPHDTVLNGSADVSIAFHRSGIAYISYINFRTSPDTAGADYVVSSTDGGVNWSEPVKVIDARELPDLPIDRPWVAVDNSGGKNDGTVYLTSMSAYWYAGKHHNYLKTSNDNGKTWSAIKQIDNADYSVGLMTKSCAAISIGSDGIAFIAYHSYDTTKSKLVRIYFARTDDLGNTFQRGVITTAIYNNTLYSGDFTRSYCISADPSRNGCVCLAWIDERYGDADVFLKRTTDYGNTWTLPLRVNDDSIHNGIGQDEVWTSFGPEGNLSVAWRDRRLCGVGDTVAFNIFTTMSTDGGNSFAPNKILSTVSSAFIKVAKGNSFIGVGSYGNSIHVDWADLRNGTLDIYYGDRSFETAVEETHTLTDGILIFPNPVSDKLIMTNNNSLPSSDYCYAEIFDIRGNIIKSFIPVNSSNLQIDASSLSNGTYFIKINFNNEYSIKKFKVLR